MKRKRPLIIAVLAVIFVGGMFLLFGRRKPDTAKMVQYQVAKVERGDVRKTVSATGTMQPWTTVDIKSKAGGRVLEMLVDAGTPVKKGQIIARIDPSDTQLAVNLAGADISSAEAKRQQSQKTYGLTIAESRIGIANARAALQAAQDGRAAAASRLTTAQRQANVQPKLTTATIEQAKASLNQAMKQRAQLDATNAQSRAAAQSAYDQAMANLQNTKADLTRQKSLLAKGFVSQQTVDNAVAQASVAQAQVDNAKAKLQTVGAELQGNIETADARVHQAKAALNSAQAGSVDIKTSQDAVKQARAALRQADAQVAQAKASLQQAEASQVNNKIRELDITAAGASEARSRATLKNATDTLEQTTVRAPSDGVVLQKYVDEGTIITSGLSLNSTGSSIVQLGDTTRMFVDVPVDESDIANVKVGQKVDVTLDAYPGVPFEGRVARINPQAIVEQNVTLIHVRVEVNNKTKDFHLLKSGMNAACDFVVAEKKNVVSVPASAIQTGKKGSFVEIAAGGLPAPADPALGPMTDSAGPLIGVKTTRQEVHVGLEGDDATEITSGLKPGETIVVQTIRPSSGDSGGGGSPFGGGRRR
jgi:HlyD family secretion protein